MINYFRLKTRRKTATPTSYPTTTTVSSSMLSSMHQIQTTSTLQPWYVWFIFHFHKYSFFKCNIYLRTIGKICHEAKFQLMKDAWLFFHLLSAEWPWPAEPFLHRDPRPPGPDSGRLLADDLGTGLRGHCHAHQATRQRLSTVPQILARGRIRAIPYLRGEYLMDLQCKFCM